jgi:hypothetical protein
VARGWESKDIEAQLDAAEQERRLQRVAKTTPQQQAAARHRASLELDRIRIQHEIAASAHPRHRAQLEAALAHIEAELARLGGDAADTSSDPGS